MLKMPHQFVASMSISGNKIGKKKKKRMHSHTHIFYRVCRFAASCVGMKRHGAKGAFDSSCNGVEQQCEGGV